MPSTTYSPADIMLILTLVLAVLVGITLGLLGGGGSILMVPLLVYVVGMEAKEAIATSLLVVCVTSAVSAVSHARGRRVWWRVGVTFGMAGMLGAYAGGRLAAYVPATWLMMGFAVMMVGTAVAMLGGQRGAGGAHQVSGQRTVRIVLDGLIVGLVTGLVGAGGGFLVVPALALLAGVPMPIAVGTSLLVIAMKSLAGLAGYLSSVSIDWGTAAAITAAAVLGAIVGGRWSGRIAAETLRRIFGWFILVMAGVVLAQESPASWWSQMPGWAWAVIGAAVMLIVFMGVWLRRSRRSEAVHARASR